MFGQADFTGSTVGEATPDTGILNLLSELAQSISVQFWMSKSLVACKTTTSDTFGNKYVTAASAGQFQELLLKSHLTSGASEVKGDSLVGRMEGQRGSHVIMDKFKEFKRPDRTYLLTHKLETGTLVTNDRIGSPL